MVQASRKAAQTAVKTAAQGSLRIEAINAQIDDLKREKTATCETVLHAVEAVGYAPNPGTEAAKKMNKAIAKAVQEVGGPFASAGIREYQSLDLDNVTDYHRDIVKRHKGLPRVVTSTAIVVCLKRA